MSLLRAWVEFQGQGVERENSDRVQWNSSGDEMELQGLGEPNIYGSQDRVLKVKTPWKREIWRAAEGLAKNLGES